MKKEIETGNDEEVELSVSIGSNFSKIDFFENLNPKCKNGLDEIKHFSFKIIQKTILTLISKQRQAGMKLVHYPQSR